MVKVIVKYTFKIIKKKNNYITNAQLIYKNKYFIIQIVIGRDCYNIIFSAYNAFRDCLYTEF